MAISLSAKSVGQRVLRYIKGRQRQRCPCIMSSFHGVPNMSHPAIPSSQIQLAIGVPPPKIETRAIATAKLKAPTMRPNWYPAKVFQLSSRRSTRETEAPAIASSPSMPERICVCGIIKTPGCGLIAFKSVSCGPTLPPNCYSRDIPVSNNTILHSQTRKTTACGTPDMFQMDELDIPASRDSQFRSPIIIDTGLEPGSQTREPSTSIRKASKVRRTAI